MFRAIRQSTIIRLAAKAKADVAPPASVPAGKAEKKPADVKAKGGKEEKKGGGGAKKKGFVIPPLPEPVNGVERVRVNIMKGGEDPILKPASEYPAWLRDLLVADKPLSECNVTEKRYWKLLNRQRIKDMNTLLAK